LTFKTATIVNAAINYGTSSDQLNKSIVEESGSYTTNHTIRLSSLTQGTSYYVQISGKDQFDKAVTSDVYVFSTLPEPGLVSLKVQNVTANSVTIVAEFNTETDILIEYVTDSTQASNLKGLTQTQGETTRAKSHTITLTGLIGNATYRYKVFAQDAYSNRFESGEQTFTTAQDLIPPAITNLKTEPLLSRRADKEEVQMIVTWDTNEPATSKVSYGKGSVPTPEDQSTVEDPTLTIHHLTMVSGLTPGTTYHFQASSKDSSGNTGQSASVTVLTPRKSRSLTQVIVEQLESIFGWIRKIGL
jgi:hypothetical protein